MDIRECYQAFGGDFDEVMTRLLAPTRVEKFALRFPGDTSFASLKEALAAGDYETAFRAAHTMKGVVQNLGFKNLYGIVELTETLRPGGDIDAGLAKEQLRAIEPEYEKTIACLNDLKNSK